MKTMIVALMLALTALPSAAQLQHEYTERFGTKYLAGRGGLQPFDSGLTIAEDRIIVTTSKRRNGLYVEAFSIPLRTVTSANLRREIVDDESVETLTIVSEAEALMFQVAPLDGAGILAKINFALKQLKASQDPPTFSLESSAAGPSQRSLRPDEFRVLGQGTSSCGDWTRTAAPNDVTDAAARVAKQSWILGFVSGTMWASMTVKDDDAFAAKVLRRNVTDSAGVIGWVNQYCGEHPLEPLVDAVQQLILALPNR